MQAEVVHRSGEAAKVGRTRSLLSSGSSGNCIWPGPDNLFEPHVGHWFPAANLVELSHHDPALTGLANRQWRVSSTLTAGAFHTGQYVGFLMVPATLAWRSQQWRASLQPDV